MPSLRPVFALPQADPSRMDFLDAFWHVLNLFAPAFGVAALAAALAKLLWRRELAGVRFVSLASAAFAAGAIVLVAGLVLLGQDGRIGTYGAMVLACALVLWWRGFLRKR